MEPMSQLLLFAFVAVGLVGCSLASRLGGVAGRPGQRPTGGTVMVRPGTNGLGSEHKAHPARVTLAHAARYPESSGAPR
ncbi:MAG: hypothetical protein JWM80_858 [Cyanobacteria bacterium RYN_339]|nr:hypothetical protein [Cyanobacteria bacterium RYN_339]